jgi:hypothetical protein
MKEFKDYLDLWNLREYLSHVPLSPGERKITVTLAKDWKEDKLKAKIALFSGNVICGNRIFNELVKFLYDINKITMKCHRFEISELFQYKPIDYIEKHDLILIDNISFCNFTGDRHLRLNSFIDLAYKYVKLLILNVPSDEDQEKMSNELIQLLEVSPYTFDVNHL